MRARDERLAAEARVHRHHQHEIEIVEHVLERRGRRGRVQRDTRARAELADLGERALEMRAGLGVHRDHVGPGRHELGDVPLRLDDHQVDVER